MITDFLNFARPVNVALYDADIVETLDSVITDVQKLRPGNYQIHFQYREKPVVEFDATLLRQSFLNLLINATEALDENGVINVSVNSPRPRDVVRIVIEDNGRGIPAAQLSKIFFPFFTTKAHGTGLGLALVQKFVIAHNGRIEVQSSEGQGTRFTVTLPRRRPATRASFV
jgi:signal transduction histidine kinase